jgi:prolyl-tRNA editing enzyme YbaK/EbsC (Cys-tRNA(Pro) deacylase)
MKELLDALAASGTSFELTRFPEEVFTAEGVAKLLGIRLGRVAKAMLLKVAEGSVILAVIPGDKRADLKAIKRHLNGRNVRLIDRVGVTAATGLKIGAVTPLITYSIRK